MALDLKQIIAQGEELGVDDIELFYEESSENNIKIYEGEVESLKSANAKGLGIRVFIDDKMGFAYTSNFSAEEIEKTLQEAIANAEVASTDEYRTLPETVEKVEKLDLYSDDLAAAELEEKIQLALDLEAAALEYDERVDSVDTVGYGDNEVEIRIVNSKGFNESYRQNQCYAYSYVIAREGEDAETGMAITYGDSVAELTPQKTGKEAAENAVALLGGQPVESQKAPVVFPPEVGSMFMYVLSQALTAEAVQKGKSVFAQKVGEEVAAKEVNIIDNGLLEEGLATAPFDGEGVPSAKTEIIKDGKLKTFLYDTYTANKGNGESTGNASRGSYRGIPGVSPSNFYLANGDSSAEGVLSSVDNGFYVMKVSGLVTGGANPISGDFSVGATGRWIEDGELTKPVREITIAGNLIDFLQDIDMIGDNLKFNPLIGSYATPTFRVKNLAISGS
ncbi:TldD/PmbA family protein [Acetohalobium arabaticum]|uniref:Peptidase U62 modulator of DNA gyrase n=1 Tax=Acetohalobium arabaticum (strain ATCC 49924 / DSM 5501 / Z-7288) TaxID=574087 RepID=D9QU96_ACEAZ|nr:TldD/PmbA family protein [Acetohalobium arabaticum]ADL11889.1 peptidase U62 modulator of DNA gyrase [Acetohalobium arabaticum DSM 5501]